MYFILNSLSSGHWKRIVQRRNANVKQDVRERWAHWSKNKWNAVWCWSVILQTIICIVFFIPLSSTKTKTFLSHCAGMTCTSEKELGSMMLHNLVDYNEMDGTGKSSPRRHRGVNRGPRRPGTNVTSSRNTVSSPMSTMSGSLKTTSNSYRWYRKTCWPALEVDWSYFRLGRIYFKMNHYARRFLFPVKTV